MVVALCSKEVILGVMNLALGEGTLQHSSGWRLGTVTRIKGQVSGKVEQKETWDERDVLSVLLVRSALPVRQLTLPLPLL